MALEIDPQLAAEIEALEPRERAYLKKMLTQLERGDARGVRAFLETDYDEAPVSIERFINDDLYLGRALKDPRGNHLVYKYWQRALKQIFNSNAIEVILTGPIGSGKSTMVSIAMAYILHMTLCLKDPFDYYQLVRAQPITLLFFSLSKDLSGVGLYKGFNELILASKWFRDRGNIVGKSNERLVFPHRNIDYSIGSPRMPGQGIVGRNIITGGLDEISEVTTAKELAKRVDFVGTKALQIYEKVARRMESRFLQAGGTQPGKLFLISSKQDEAAFIERYVEKVKGSPHVLIFDDPIWEIKPQKLFPSGKTFGVAIGDKYRDSKLMSDSDDEDELEEQGFDVIYVPVELKRSFDLDVNGALRDIAGISSTTTRRSKLIPRAEYLKRCINPELQHPFKMKTVYLSDERGDNDGIEDSFEMQDAFVTSKRHFIHVDLGLNGDAAGIAMCHINRVKEIERLMEDGTIVKMRDNVVRYDFLLQVRNSTGASIPFWKIRRFIVYLRKKGVKIGCITFDGWQSVDCMQLLTHADFNTALLSIDKNDVPYVTFRNAVYEERAEWYEYSPLIDEASELEHFRRLKKVDHPEDGSKDVADAAAGAMFKALEEAGQQPQPQRTVEALREMAKAETGGIDPKWWIGDI